VIATKQNRKSFIIHLKLASLATGCHIQPIHNRHAAIQLAGSFDFNTVPAPLSSDARVDRHGHEMIARPAFEITSDFELKGITATKGHSMNLQQELRIFKASSSLPFTHESVSTTTA
jgi:hypothetical protein